MTKKLLRVRDIILAGVAVTAALILLDLIKGEPVDILDNLIDGAVFVVGFLLLRILAKLER